MTASAPALLERALVYTLGVLRHVPASPAGIPTPCRGWDLAHLLAHLEDAVDAFTEAAAGAVRVAPPGPSGCSRPGEDHSARLERKAARLLGAWTGSPPARVRLGDRSLPADVLVPAAALEIAVHGWDVAWSVDAASDRGVSGGIEPALARDLTSPAALLVPRGSARAGRFDPPPVYLSGPERDLLAWLGRDAAVAQAAGSDSTNRAPLPGAPS